MRVKPVNPITGLFNRCSQRTPEEHAEAHKNVGRLVKWSDRWPSGISVAIDKYTGIIVRYTETYHGTYHVYRDDGQLEPIAYHRVSFFTA